MNEVAKIESRGVATQAHSQEQVLQGDITIPKVLQMQALSDLVSEDKAKAGDFIRSTTGEVLGGAKAPLLFIPLTFQNLWMISANEMGDNKTYKFKKYEDRTPTNERDEWEFFENGIKMKRTKVMTLFALLPADVEKKATAIRKYKETGEIPDLDAALMPVVIPFRNTSFKAAKEVIDLFTKAADLAASMGVEVPVFGRTMRLTNTLESNDKGKYYVLKVEAAGPTKKEYFQDAATWRQRLLGMGKEAVTKVDNSDEAAPAAEPFANQF